MSLDKSVFVVVRAYNEDIVLAETIAGLVPYGYSIVVVDDGSTTPQHKFIEVYPVHYVRHVTNLGPGAALQTGITYAIDQEARVIVHFDGDGQHNPAQIARVVESILAGTCDVVFGSRFLDPADRNRVPWKKRILLKGGVFVSWIFTGVWLTDTHNGFRALSQAAAIKIKLTENGFAYATEILEQIKDSGLRYKEVPTTVEYTEYSQQKGQSMFNSVNIVIDLLVRKVLR